MKDQVQDLLDMMKGLLVLAKVSARQVAMLVEDDVDHAGVHEALLSIKDIEYAAFEYAYGLVTPEVWAWYECKDVSKLREVKMRRSAEIALRKAWRSRVSVFLRKKEEDASKQEEAGVNAQGVDVRSQSTGTAVNPAG